MIIYVIRHGETKPNVDGLLCGQTDVPLNQNGIKLAEITGEGLQEVCFDEVFTSPLQRAFDTAKIILSKNKKGCSIIHTDARLMELAWGSWELRGCTPENYDLPCDNFNLFYTDAFAFPYPEDGETMRELCDRTQEFLDDLVSDPKRADSTILITTHGCTSRGLTHPSYEDPNEFWHGICPPNCAVNIMEYSDGKYTLLEEDKIYYDASMSPNLFKAVE